MPTNIPWEKGSLHAWILQRYSMVPKTASRSEWKARNELGNQMKIKSQAINSNHDVKRPEILDIQYL